MGANLTKKQCSYEGCTNVAQAGGVCTRHGAKLKRCSRDRCTNQAQKLDLCTKHGAKRKLCSYEGCSNVAQKGGVCEKHGAKRKWCTHWSMHSPLNEEECARGTFHFHDASTADIHLTHLYVLELISSGQRTHVCHFCDLSIKKDIQRHTFFSATLSVAL